MQRAQIATAVAFFLAVLIGCEGSRTAEVTGTVQFAGEIIDDGAIAFYPEDGKSQSAGGSIKEGKYSARVPIGAMKVTISWPKPYGPKKKLYDNDPNSPEIALKSEALPKKYADPTETTLTFEVKAGGNLKDWDLAK